MISMFVILTDHARQRILERLKCNPSKCEKIALKAWLATEQVHDGEIPNKRMYETEIHITRKQVYRKLMGFIFVFAIESKRVILISMMPPANKIAKSKIKPFLIGGLKKSSPP